MGKRERSGKNSDGGRKKKKSKKESPPSPSAPDSPHSSQSLAEITARSKALLAHPDGPRIHDFVSEALRLQAQAIARCSRFPLGAEHGFCMTDPDIRGNVRGMQKKLCRFMHAIGEHEYPSGSGPLSLADSGTQVDDVLEHFPQVTEVVDGLLDNVDDFLDARQDRGDGSTSSIVSESSIKALQKGGRKDVYVFHGSNIVRPQLKFKTKVDNSTSPFVPVLSSKPNSVVPLEKVFQNYAKIDSLSRAPVSPALASHLADALGIAADVYSGQNASYPHPYLAEIEGFQHMPTQLQAVKEQLYAPIEQCPPIWVDTVPALQDMKRVLDDVPEFAVDLEQHGYRSFQGFCCLMQISTRTQDYLVDTLALREHMHVLNSSFTNPAIVKVLHGCDSDVVWLQRDFGLYLVNVFDTGQASRTLDFPYFSLAYLLKFYCSITADKKYQLADWRIRPLPAEMLLYAQQDTHYLLYIADRMRNELLERSVQGQNLMRIVLENSRNLCKKTYEKPRITATSHLDLLQKNNLSLNSAQINCFQALYEWRDRVGREEDESTRYVLPNHMLFRIAELQPTTVDELFACCLPVVPPLVRLHAHDVLRIMSDAADKQEAKEVSRTIPPELRLSAERVQAVPMDTIKSHSPDPVRSLRNLKTLLHPENKRSASSPLPNSLFSPEFLPLSVSSKKFQALKRELEQATLLELVQSSPGLALAAAQSGNDEAESSPKSTSIDDKSVSVEENSSDDSSHQSEEDNNPTEKPEQSQEMAMVPSGPAPLLRKGQSSKSAKHLSCQPSQDFKSFDYSSATSKFKRVSSQSTSKVDNYDPMAPPAKRMKKGKFKGKREPANERSQHGGKSATFQNSRGGSRGRGGGKRHRG